MDLKELFFLNRVEQDELEMVLLSYFTRGEGDQLYKIGIGYRQGSDADRFRNACTMEMWSTNGTEYYALRPNEFGNYLRTTYRGEYDTPYYCGLANYSVLGNLLAADYSFSSDSETPKIVPGSLTLTQ